MVVLPLFGEGVVTKVGECCIMRCGAGVAVKGRELITGLIGGDGGCGGTELLTSLLILVMLFMT